MHIDKFALGVRVGPGFISTSPINNTKMLCNQREAFNEKYIRKRDQEKSFMEVLRHLYFNTSNRKTNKMKVLKE